MRLFSLIFTLFFCLILNGQPLDFYKSDFKRADSIANNYNNNTLNNLPVLVYNLTSNLDTEVEKFRSIYKWVCTNIEADHYFGEKTIRTRKKYKSDNISFMKWNEEMQSKMYKKLLKDKKTICSGYAYLLKELCALANIKCEVVNGYSRTINTNVNKIDIPNHSWNAVELNNKWYLVDATLASGFFFVNENRFIKNYNDRYFLVNPELFIKSHYPLDYKWTLLKQQINIDDYVKAPLIYGKRLKHNILPIVPERLKTEISKDESIVFKLRVSKESQIQDFEVVLSNGQSYHVTTSENYSYKNGILEFQYHFKRRGIYDLNLKIANDIIVSYTIKVNKLSRGKNLLSYNL